MRNAKGAPSEAFSGASSTVLPLSTILPTHECPPPHPENAMSFPRRSMYHLRHHASELVEAEAAPAAAVAAAVSASASTPSPGVSEDRLLAVAAAATAAAASMEVAGLGRGGQDCPSRKPPISCVWRGMRCTVCGVPVSKFGLVLWRRTHQLSGGDR